jgi:hypothetical protein
LIVLTGFISVGSVGRPLLDKTQFPPPSVLLYIADGPELEATEKELPS